MAASKANKAYSMRMAKQATKKGKAIRFFEDEMSGRRYDWSGKKRVGSGNTDSASVPERRKFESKKKAKPTGKMDKNRRTY
jgi:hypothetical protein